MVFQKPSTSKNSVNNLSEASVADALATEKQSDPAQSSPLSDTESTPSDLNRPPSFDSDSDTSLGESKWLPIAGA